MRTLLVAALLCGPALAYADDRTPDAKAMHTDDCAQARKHNKACVIDMGKDDDITAKTPTHEEPLLFLDYFKSSSLIRVRRDFIVEIIKSAEDL
jgi:hypothetical protein